MEKGLVVSVILLFIGVAIAPSINFNVVKASNDNDLVEVTTQACGISGFGDTTVKLTRQQYQNLEQYLVDFRARLNQTTTREEAVPIFKEAVVELNKYGLLPRGMSVEQVQKLVVGGYQNEKLMKRLSKLSEYKINNSSTLVNHFCLITGETNHTAFCPIPCSIFAFSSYYLLWFTLLMLIPFLTALLSTFLAFLAYLSFYFSNIISPIVFGSVYLGFHYGNYDLPSFGWIQTYGLYGNKSIEGSFYGHLIRIRLWLLWEALGSLNILPFFPGISGFLGIKIYTPSTDTQFYLGSALSVSISSKPILP